MEYPLPMPNIITIYSKSGCINCKKSKTYLTNANISFNIIDCDDFLLENKSDFLLFIKNISNVDINTFPIIFNGTEFIGGYNELIKLNDFNTNTINNNNNCKTNLDFDASF